MAPRENSQEAIETPDPVEKGFATLATLRVGVKAFVEKDNEERKAEVLGLNDRNGQPFFYVHYEDFNKRLDEWVSGKKFNLEKEVEWPAPEKSEKKKVIPLPPKAEPKAPKGQKRLKGPANREFSQTPDTLSTNIQSKPLKPSEAGGKENVDTVMVQAEVLTGTPGADDDEMDVVEMQEAAAIAKASGPQYISRENEIEKLRTSGSMTQDQTQISRMRNIDRVQMGEFRLESWYFSPYPVEMTNTNTDLLYICEFCLSYFGNTRTFERHRSKCTLMHPPGNEIYRDENVSFFEIDGRRQRTWCRNLCLLSKLFLDHKTLYYDVDPFLFYCMTTRDERGCHFVGYFSKEKESAEGYNVACILTLPQYQRKGFGYLLIAFSYELSKREGRSGSPEKPLSDLGLLGYRAYWQATIVDLLMDGRNETTVDELGTLSAMTTNDVLHTLQNLNMLRTSKGSHVVVLTDAIVEQKEKQTEKEKIKGKRRIDPTKLQWKPPVFTASSRTWNW
ncbi:MAG: Histone acetyltransferase [Vezdaea aestivalis]|nr:MAG: Histone acetyltransferase [Vezdaea aestivalis]